MLHIPKTGDYLQILTDDDVKKLLVINSGEYFKSTKEKLCSTQNEEENLRKVVESLYIFLITHDEVGKFADMMQASSSYNCICQFNIKNLNLF